MVDEVHRIRLRDGIRTVGYDAAGQYKTEPTYAEYVLAEHYDALAAQRDTLEAMNQALARDTVDFAARLAAAVSLIERLSSGGNTKLADERHAFLRTADNAGVRQHEDSSSPDKIAEILATLRRWLTEGLPQAEAFVVLEAIDRLRAAQERSACEHGVPYGTDCSQCFINSEWL